MHGESTLGLVEVHLCKGLCRSAEVLRPLGERVGRPLVREGRVESVGMAVRLGEARPVPLLLELRGLAPCVGEVGLLRRPLTPREGCP